MTGHDNAHVGPCFAEQFGSRLALGKPPRQELELALAPAPAIRTPDPTATAASPPRGSDSNGIKEPVWISPGSPANAAERRRALLASVEQGGT